MHKTKPVQSQVQDQTVSCIAFLRAVGNANYRDDCHTGFDKAKPRGY